MKTIKDEFHALKCKEFEIGVNHIMRLYDFLVSVKAAPHECVIRTGLP